MSHYIFPNYSIEKFLKNLDELVKVFNKFGVIILPGLLNSEKNYLNHMHELDGVFDDIINRHLNKNSRGLEIGEKLTLMASINPSYGKIISNLGSQPNKFFSFNQLKHSYFLRAFLQKVWGEEKSLIVSPPAGDTLHLFPPIKDFQKYNLPPHQDYQYLMQSPAQITMYYGISKNHKDVGGLRIWEKSHRLGILKSTKNKHGAFEIHDHKEVLRDFSFKDYNWNRGDFGIFDSLLAHSSIPNQTKNRSRIVQIFRFSNINNDIARSYDFAPKTYAREHHSKDFEEIHKNLYED
jgi:hypothetical protein